MLRIASFGFGLLIAISNCGISEEPAAKDNSAKKYRELIEQLVSPNEKPITTIRGGAHVKFPAGYNVEAQKRIKAARQELHDNFEEALPFLIEALDDKRYCMTIDWAEGDGYYNYSVGAICRNVIASQLEVYRDKMMFYGPQDWNRYNYEPISKVSWQELKGRSLTELQIEAIDWALEKRMAEPEGKVVGDRANEIADLRKLRDEITKSKKPAKAQRMLRMVVSDK